MIKEIGLLLLCFAWNLAANLVILCSDHEFSEVVIRALVIISYIPSIILGFSFGWDFTSLKASGLYMLYYIIFAIQMLVYCAELIR